MSKWVLLLMVSTLLLSGCAGQKDAINLAYGDHSKVRVGHEDLNKKNSLNLIALSNLCRSYYVAKDFAQFKICSQRYFSKFPRDKVIQKKTLFGGIQNNYDQNPEYHYQMLSSNALMSFEVEDYNSSIEFAEMAEKQAMKTFHAEGAFALTSPEDGPLMIKGMAFAKQNNRTKAISIINDMKKITQFGLQNWIDNNVLSSSAKIYFALRDYNKAYNEIIQVVDTFDDKLIKFKKENTAETLPFYLLQRFYIHAISAYKVGKIKEASAKLEHFLSRKNAKNFTGLYSFALYYRALIDLNANKQSIAINRLMLAIKLLEKQRSSIANDASRIGFAGDKQEVYSMLVKTLMDTGRYDEAFAYAERGKARALVDMLASKQQFGSTISTSEQNKLLAQLDTAEAKDLVISGDTERSTTRSIVIKNREALSQQAPELSSLVTVEAPDVKEIQSLLPKGETLIEYYGSGDALFAFVVTANGIRGVKLEGKGLQADVTAFREAILNPKGKAYQQSGKRLYNRLIVPVTSGINTKNITIVPHGALHYLPFAALSDGNQFLIDRYKLRVLPSASVMKFLKQHQNKAGTLLAFGNPDLGEAKYDLPFAQKEAEKIARETVGAKLLVRGQATETAVKTYGNSFRYLHFASHGTFDAEKPLNSGLLLAKDSQNDGMLTVGELYDLNLNADLVTLSACETALGKVANGDDVVGFTRGFLYAGASSIVSSLWQVDDAATSDLMTGFYANLGTTDKRSALRNAQLSTKAKYHHPYYWAAFQITGAVQ
ncbi:CHAT domain-containing protein [Mariprofundus sp. EBB-1]|uniref:CHAT domain-containing protein n=1 Tax=Mariprofundus sp. EBB-1 TaxID=2650971 RepID=UPI00137AB074|nr:CHAT domain-containing protein [Mariprofundus sp. EBB-1]